MLSTDQKAAALGVCPGRASRKYNDFEEWILALAPLHPAKATWHSAMMITAKLLTAATLAEHPCCQNCDYHRGQQARLLPIVQEILAESE